MAYQISRSENQVALKYRHKSTRPYSVIPHKAMINVTSVTTWNLSKCSKIHKAQIQFIQFTVHVLYGPGTTGTATCYVCDGPEIESWWSEIFRTRPVRPCGPPCLLYNRYQIIPGVKRPACGDDHPPASNAELKEIELHTYLCYPLGFRGLLLGEPFHLIHCFTWNRVGVGIGGGGRRSRALSEHLLRREYFDTGENKWQRDWANDQLDAQIFNTFITILYMYMFRAISCSSSGGQIVLTHWGRSGSFKLFKRPFPGFLTILTL